MPNLYFFECLLTLENQDRRDRYEDDQASDCKSILLSFYFRQIRNTVFIIYTPHTYSGIPLVKSVSAPSPPVITVVLMASLSSTMWLTQSLSITWSSGSTRSIGTTNTTHESIDNTCTCTPLLYLNTLSICPFTAMPVKMSTNCLSATSLIWWQREPSHSSKDRNSRILSE